MTRRRPRPSASGDRRSPESAEQAGRMALDGHQPAAENNRRRTGGGGVTGCSAGEVCEGMVFTVELGCQM